MTTLHDLYQNQGQSVWLDFISRDLLDQGGLAELIDKGVRGVTSNPTIFEKAISGSDTYDGQIRTLLAGDDNTFHIYDEISRADVARAADLLYPLYQRSEGGDGYVSIEVSPDLAYDTAGTIAEAQRLWQGLNRPNIMIKVPATAEGILAIRSLIALGININATLMFSLSDYDRVAFAYIEGLEERARASLQLNRVASVASFFVSRIDGVVDAQLDKVGNSHLQGKIAIANAKLAYRRFQEVFGSDRWRRLAERGGRVQRPLWASTSTKNPNYKDVLYVDTLIGPHTVNTLPLPTIEAAIDHAVVSRTIDKEVDQAFDQVQALSEFGIDFDQVTADLQTAGVRSFADSFHSLLSAISTRSQRLRRSS